MKSIRIEEPCHEDWSKMNPTQQGAFCGKCEIDVVDFSRLNLTQIKSVLKENAGKHMCGRFDNNQLAELNNDFQNWQNNNPRNFQSKFVYVLLLVFGLSLFSCSNEDAKQIAEFSSIEMQAALAEPDQKLADQLFFYQDAIIADEMMRNLEVVRCERTTGMVESVTYEDRRIDNIIEVDRMGQLVAGGVGYDREYLAYLNVPDSVESTLPTEIVNPYNPFETKAFPNPTRDISNVSLYIHEATQFNIEVYSLSGQKVEEIHNGELPEGRQNFEINFSDYAPGTYLIKVWSDKQEETLKVIRVE